MASYDKDFEFKDPKYRSATLTNGIARSGQRALLYANGMDEEDMKKPFVAIVGSFSEMVPGHRHLQELAEYVKMGVIEAGGVPVRSETICICDGLCQGHMGMRYPLASRELIADSVEMAADPRIVDSPKSVEYLSYRDLLNPCKDELLEEIKTKLSPDYLGIKENLSMIAVVGERGTESSDANVKVLHALDEAGIEISTINQGAGKLNLLIGVPEERYKDAIRAVYSSIDSSLNEA